jgi:hypothetical protein
MNVRAKPPAIRDLTSGARRGWETRGRCKNADPGDFETHDLEGGIPQRARDAAEYYGRHCPVLRDCRLAADVAKPTGLRGGEWRTIQDKASRYVKIPLIPVESLLRRQELEEAKEPNLFDRRSPLTRRARR